MTHLIHILPMRNWNQNIRELWLGTGVIHILPMRNWNINPEDEVVFVDRFTSYLWGIETKICPRKSINLLLFTSYLWGIETFRKLLHCIEREIFTSYLWGIETRWPHSRTAEHRHIHILPMRNWNTATLKASKKIPANSHPTYEELKQIFMCLFFQLLLKIHILPMRNWNRPPASTTPGLKPRFTSYLWGIETWWYAAARMNQIQFTSYLWGIETWWRFSACSKYQDSHPTYEELKQEHLCENDERWRIHILPMRNWNTSSRKELIARPAFTSYLWGIETMPQGNYPLK